MLASRSRLRVGAFGSAYSAPKNLGIGSILSDVEDAAPTGARNNQPALLDRGIGSILSVVEDAAPTGAHNNQPALLDRGVVASIAADGGLVDAVGYQIRRRRRT